MTTPAAVFVCGVDIGTTYATACLLPVRAASPPAFAIMRTASVAESSPDGARRLAVRMRAELGTWTSMISVARLERPMGRHVRSVANLSRTLGALATIFQPATSVDEITPGEWKQLCGLPYRATVAEYTAWVTRLMHDPPHPPSEHEAAAYGIAWSIIADGLKEIVQDGLTRPPICGKLTS